MLLDRPRIGRAGKNVLILATCQGLLFSINTVFAMVSGLVGATLAPDPSLATVPLGLFITGAALSTYPASLLMGRIGRRLGFLIGASVGFYGGVLGAWAVAIGSFELLCFTGLFMGIYFAFGQYYRFAIADVATGALKRHAVSIVLAGGVFSGVLGPHSADWSRDLLAPQTFMASYAVVSALAYLKLLLLAFIDIPTPPKAERRHSGRPLGEIIRQPRFIVAAIAGMVSWAAMNQLMMGGADRHAPVFPAVLRCGVRHAMAQLRDVSSRVLRRRARQQVRRLQCDAVGRCDDVWLGCGGRDGGSICGISGGPRSSSVQDGASCSSLRRSSSRSAAPSGSRPRRRASTISWCSSLRPSGLS